MQKPDNFKGYISHQGFSITCGGCMKMQYLHVHTRQAASAEAKEQGWRYTRRQGWICPACQEKNRD